MTHANTEILTQFEDLCAKRKEEILKKMITKIYFQLLNFCSIQRRFYFYLKNKFYGYIIIHKLFYYKGVVLVYECE